MATVVFLAMSTHCWLSKGRAYMWPVKHHFLLSIFMAYMEEENVTADYCMFT